MLKIHDEAELDLAVQHRDDLERLRSALGPELNELKLELDDYDRERQQIEDRLKHSAWPNLMDPMVIPTRVTREQTRNKVGQVITRTVERPAWPKRPPAFVIDRELRRTLFARLDRMREEYAPSLAKQHELKAEWRRLSEEIEDIDGEIAKYRAKPPKPPKKPRGGDQPRLI